jgi:hypothetical protein
MNTGAPSKLDHRLVMDACARSMVVITGQCAVTCALQWVRADGKPNTPVRVETCVKHGERYREHRDRSLAHKTAWLRIVALERGDS